MKKFIPEVKEVKYIENKEQQKLTAEQELVEDSYYFENEAWSDISVQKNYGPGHFPPTNCSAHPQVFVHVPGTERTYTEEGVRLGRQPNGSWCCAFHRSSWGSNNDSVMSTVYRCARQGCPTIVSRSGDFCSTHNNTTSTQQYNCSYYGCRNSVSTRGGYCPDHGGS